MSELDKLIESVEAGGDLPEIGHGYWQFLPAGACILAARTYHEGSLDDALTLHEALLPGWALERLNMWPGTNGQCTAYLWGTHEEDGERWHNAKDGRVDANGTIPARAWLLAILRAYRSVQA